MSVQAIVASQIGVLPGAILRVEEWVSVLFVVAKKIGGRFVSKSILKSVCVNVGRAKEVKPDGSNTIVTNAHDKWSNGWVALCSRGKEFGQIERSFLSGDRALLSRSGNGDIIYRDVPDGYYEAESVIRSYQAGREWFKIEDSLVTNFESQDDFIAAIWDTTVENLLDSREQALVVYAQAQKEKNQKIVASLQLSVPHLLGSEKQIAWAEELRAKHLNVLEDKLNLLKQDEELLQRLALEIGRKSGASVVSTRLMELLKSYFNAVAQKQESKFWIDRRSSEHVQDMFVWAVKQCKFLKEKGKL